MPTYHPSTLDSHFDLFGKLAEIPQSFLEDSLHVLHAFTFVRQFSDAVGPIVNLSLVRCDLGLYLRQVSYYPARLLAYLRQVGDDVRLVGLVDVFYARLHLIEAQKRHPFHLSRQRQLVGTATNLHYRAACRGLSRVGA